MRSRLRSHLKAITIVDILPLRSIIESPYPLRDQPGDIEELAKSIKSKGLLEPIIVRPVDSKFEIVAGHRRFRACKANRFSEIPSIVIDATDKTAYEISLEENIQRKSLDPIEEAKAFSIYVDKYGYGSISELARNIGKSEEYVSHRIRLLDLPASVQDLVRRRLLTSSDAWEIARVEGATKQEEVAELAVVEKLTVRELRNVANSAILQARFQRSLPEEARTPKGGVDPGLHESQRRDYAQRRALRTRQAALSVLRIALIRLDDLLNNSVDEENEDLRQQLVAARYQLHATIDQLMGDKRGKDKTKEEIAAFIEQLFLQRLNEKNLLPFQRFKSKHFTTFDDLPPHRLMDLKMSTEQEARISKMLRDCKCDIQDLRVDRFGGGAIATFTMVYNMKMNGHHCNWKSRVTFVFERADESWILVHAHWSPYEFDHGIVQTINSLKQVLEDVA